MNVHNTVCTACGLDELISIEEGTAINSECKSVRLKTLLVQLNYALRPETVFDRFE